MEIRYKIILTRRNTAASTPSVFVALNNTLRQRPTNRASNNLIYLRGAINAAHSLTVQSRA